MDGPGKEGTLEGTVYGCPDGDNPADTAYYMGETRYTVSRLIRPA